MRAANNGILIQLNVEFARVWVARLQWSVQENILAARANSGFYRVLLKQLVMDAAISSQQYSVLLALQYLGFAFTGFRVWLCHVYTRRYECRICMDSQAFNLNIATGQQY